MAEDEVLPENLAFLDISDPGDESDAGAPPEPSDDSGSTQAAPAPQYAPQEALPPQEDPNERRFRGVLNELRDTRQELRAYREAERDRRAEEERRQQLAEMPPPPDKEADPAAWLAYQNRMTAWEVEQQRVEREEGYRAEQEAVQVRQQFFGTVAQQEDHFRSQVPDYDQAVNYTKQLRAQELQGLGLSPEQVDYQLKKELIGFSALNLGNGQSPAEAAYRYAVSRGFRPYAYQQQPQYSAPQAAPQRMNQSLSAVGGGGGGVGVTLQNLAQQPVQVQNLCMDDPAIWQELNLGGTVYPR